MGEGGTVKGLREDLPFPFPCPDATANKLNQFKVKYYNIITHLNLQRSEWIIRETGAAYRIRGQWIAHHLEWGRVEVVGAGCVWTSLPLLGQGRGGFPKWKGENWGRLERGPRLSWRWHHQAHRLLLDPQVWMLRTHQAE